MINDSNTEIKKLKELVEEFVAERDWEQFHTPKNLSMAIASEAAELMELFLWVGSETSKSICKQEEQKVKEELADIIIVCLCFANRANLDVATIVTEKIKEIKKKYPADKAKGKWQKYTSYQEEDKKVAK